MNIILNLKEKARIIVQILFTVLTNGYAEGLSNGYIYQGASKKICVPGLNCYSCPGALGSCPIGSLQAVLGSKDYKFSFYIIGFFMVVGTLFGRAICGWLCPFGLVQDLLYKIPFPKIKKLPGDKYLRYLKYVILLIFVIILPITVVNVVGEGSPWFCKWICPSGTLLAGIPLIGSNPNLQQAIGFLFNWKISILILILILSMAIYRPFCRYLCPLGAVYAIFNPISIFRYDVDKNKCNGCELCKKKCSLDIEVYKKPNSPECIRCGKCKKVCSKGAITSSFSRKYKVIQKNKNLY